MSERTGNLAELTELVRCAMCGKTLLVEKGRRILPCPTCGGEEFHPERRSRHGVVEKPHDA